MKHLIYWAYTILMLALVLYLCEGLFSVPNRPFYGWYFFGYMIFMIVLKQLVNDRYKEVMHYMYAPGMLTIVLVLRGIYM